MWCCMRLPWEGFKLNVPDKALPDGISEYPVNIKASQMGQFELPEGYELVSAVYWVYVPGRFTKPLTIEVQHCANFSNPNQLHFVNSSCTQKSLPYKFKVDHSTAPVSKHKQHEGWSASCKSLSEASHRPLHLGTKALSCVFMDAY